MDHECVHSGHRQRMLERLERGEELKDHELLEILLYSFIPRADTNETGHELLAAFGSLPAVFRADPKQLSSVGGIGKKTAEEICLLGKILERLLVYREKDIPSALSFEKFSGYLRARFAPARQEYAELYGVKKNGDVTICKRFTSQQADRVSIPAREIAKFLADFDPPQVILVHNHLVNNYYPSAEDDRFTKLLVMQLSFFNVPLLDHYIVSPTGIYSYFLEGRMEEFRRRYDASAFSATL